jgi:transposase-like protein
MSMKQEDDNQEKDWSEYPCLNIECPDYGETGEGNKVRFERRYGVNRVALLRCRTCKETFSEYRGTPFFGLKLPYDKLYQVLTSLVRCGSIRGTADTVGVDKNTVLRILRVAGEKMKEFNEFMLRNLKMDQAQCDEFWTFVGTKRGSSTTTTRARGTSR